MIQLDANQVIRTIYDQSTKSLQVVSTNIIVDTTTWLDSMNAGADQTSQAINVLQYRVVGVMANWSSIDNTNGSLQFQGSLDGSVWDNVGSAVTVSTASGHKFFSLVDEPYKYMQLVYTHGSNTTGTITAKYVLRA